MTSVVVVVVVVVIVVVVVVFCGDILVDPTGIPRVVFFPVTREVFSLSKTTMRTRRRIYRGGGGSGVYGTGG